MNSTHRLVGGTTALVATTSAGLPVHLVAGACGVAYLASSWPDDAEKIFKLDHRRITHRPAVQALVLGLPVLAVAVWLPTFLLLAGALAAAALLGCVMHSVADAMTVEKRGIQLLWPIRRRGYHLLPYGARIWVGSKSPSEWVFVAVWCALVLSFLYVRFRHQISS